MLMSSLIALKSPSFVSETFVHISMKVVFCTEYTNAKLVVGDRCCVVAMSNCTPHLRSFGHADVNNKLHS
jgi:hypothetical protein